MTSSLVGSEMCIRDRSISTAGAYSTHGDVCRLLVDFVLLICVLDEGRAVSYTHLTLPTICSV
eukprot:8310970-Prorocentrum_lima.AAC.1